MVSHMTRSDPFVWLSVIMFNPYRWSWFKRESDKDRGMGGTKWSECVCVCVGVGVGVCVGMRVGV